MVRLFSKLEISERIFKDEYNYMNGNKANENVTFIYCNEKTGKETEREMSYRKAFDLFLSRYNDGRYKNFTFAIV